MPSSFYHNFFIFQFSLNDKYFLVQTPNESEKKFDFVLRKMNIRARARAIERKRHAITIIHLMP